MVNLRGCIPLSLRASAGAAAPLPFFFSPFMVTVAEDLAPAALFKKKKKNQEHSEYVAIIPKSLHLGLQLCFSPPGMRAQGV